MANLSNINNKFLVTTEGNVLIGQTSAVGSSIFQVTGNATFTGTGTFADAVIVTGTYPGLVLDNPSHTKFALTNRHTDNRMSFDVTPQGGSTVEVMNLKSNGLGIGTDSPGSILDVVDTAGTTTLTLGRSGEVPEIKAGGTNTDLRLSAVGPGGFLQFQTNGSSRMLIQAGGNVGIGITNPTNKLEVAGNINVIAPNPYIWIGESGSGGGAGFIGWNDASNYLYLGHSYGSAFNKNLVINSSGNVGIGITSPNTKLDVSGTTGTRNRNTQGSSVYETSLYFNAAGNATTNVSIDTTTAFPPIVSGGFILVEVSASGYGNSGSNGLVFSYISGGYGGHYGGQGQAYHPVEIIANTMQAGSCTFYYPNSTTIGIAVTTTNSVGLNGLMRVKVTSTY